MDKNSKERFDKRILDKAADMAAQLIEFPEVRSAAVVLDWDLPGNIATGLPVATYRITPDTDIIAAADGIQTASIKLIATTAANVLALIRADNASES